MAALQEILVNVAKQVVNHLGDLNLTPGVSVVETPRARRGFTDGYYATVLEADDFHGELWLDHYSGHKEPFFWYGISPSSYKKTLHYVDVCRRLGFQDQLVEIGPRDATGGGSAGSFRKLRRPLETGAFDRIIVDINRPQGEFFIGIFDPRVPSQSSTNADIARQAAVFFSWFAARQPEAESFTNPLPRPDKRVEVGAVAYVRKLMTSRGFRVVSREHEFCGYDLLALGDEGELHIEVKGTSATTPSCYLTSNEWRVAKQDPTWRLFMVTSALEAPSHTEYSSEQVESCFSFSPRLWYLSPV